MYKNSKNVLLLIMVTVLIVFLFLSPVMAFPKDAKTQDVVNSSDHPLISRFADSYIRYYEERSYGEFIFPYSELDKLQKGERKGIPTEDKGVEGKITESFYVIPDGHSTLEVFRNYEMALKKAGFEIIRKQERDLGYDLKNRFYGNISWDSCQGNEFNGVGVYCDTGKQTYLTARLKRSQGDVFISLYVADHEIHGGNWGKKRPAVYQVIVEEKDLKTGLVTANSNFEETEIKTDRPLFPAEAKKNDVSDSRDHPAISRFPGSYIRYYELKNYGEFTFPFSELEEPKNEEKKNESFPLDDKRVEGKINESFYVIPNGHSTLEVFRNYEQALKEAGFEIIRKQERDLGYNLKNRFYSEINWDSCPGNEFNGVGVYCDTGKQTYLTARLERSQGDVFISLYVADHEIHGGNWGKKRPAVYQVIVEEKKLKTGLITVESIMQDIKSQGKASIYGVYFDTDSTVIKAKSEPTVEKIAAVLKDNTNLKFHIVGHTDSTGEFKYNMQLSQKRAEALVEKLISEYDIDKNRLEASGVGPLAPKASNETEDGRAKNRRVELVKM